MDDVLWRVFEMKVLVVRSIVSPVVMERVTELVIAVHFAWIDPGKFLAKKVEVQKMELGLKAGEVADF